MLNPLHLMKCSALIALIAGISAVAAAQGPRERPRFILQALDLDHDGTLSTQEIKAAPVSLRALDRNGDGQITPDEMEPQRNDAGASPDQLAAQLMSFDRNGDGVLTPDELPERLRPLFARADTNKDGKLTPVEIKAVAGRTISPSGPQTEPGNASGMMRQDPILNALDVNHDGVISAEEIAAAGTSLLTLDVNHDGTLAPDEMRVRQQTPAERAAHMLDEFDKNEDGKLSLEEVPENLRPRFSGLDKNGDGYLDSSELILLYSDPQPLAPNRNPGASQTPNGPPKGN